jgi:hypothetical protein
MKEQLFHLATLINTDPLPGSGQNDFTNGQTAKIRTIVFGISGAIALLIIVIAGFKYITSQGNPQAVAQSKNAIIYAGVGLTVLLLADAIVAFVVKGTT